MQKLYNFNPMQPISSINQPEIIQPLLASMRTQNDHLPKNDLPVDDLGTIQQNAETAAKPKLTLYNAHGIINKEKPNSLLAYA
jgi:hypothetical protein